LAALLHWRGTPATCLAWFRRPRTTWLPARHRRVAYGRSTTDHVIHTTKE